MPAPHVPSQRPSTVRQRIGAAFTQHLSLKAVAVFLTLVLWMVVRVKEPSDEFVPVRFEPILDSSLTLRGQRPTVRARVIGSGQDLLKLYQNPPVIRKLIDGDVPDELHLDLAPEDVDIPTDVPVIVRDVQPRAVTLRFESQARRMVPVRSALRFLADSGILTGPPRFEPDSVTISGDRRLVGKLDAVSTVANDIVVREAMDVVVPLDTSSLGVRVSPSSVKVSVQVRRAQTTVGPARERAGGGADRGARAGAAGEGT